MAKKRTTSANAYRKAEQKIAHAVKSGAKILDLSELGLEELPDSIGQLTALAELDLHSNQLTELPESIGQLTALEKLLVYHNQLTELPESIGQLTALVMLYLFNNQLTELPESIGQLTALETLIVYDNQLTSLPESFGKLTALKMLDLDGNQLTEFPESIGQLTALKKLDLRNTQLTDLPEWIGQLTVLQSLYLQDNKLTDLPESIGQLTALKSLDLRYNHLTELPESIAELSELTRLFLHRNDFLGIPVEVLGPTFEDVAVREAKAADPAAILDYYFSTRGVQGQELREVKLIVVGRGGAGKTSLIRRLNGLPLDPGESETHGINISPLELKCSDGPVTARVWDFGGQHVLHAMHEFFLTARSLYLLVLGEREDMAERDAAYWLQLIRSYAGEAPVVVALNKSQGRPRELDRDSLNKNYGPIVGWVATECAEGEDATIDELRTALERAADEMPGVRSRFPKKWWEIKQSLEEMSEPYLDYGAFQTRCNKLGEKDAGMQATLAAWLNDLGVAINYADDERLHETTVLRPDWLANGIYAILRANDPRHAQQFAPGAMLSAQQLGPIYAASEKLEMLKAKDYPEDKWPFLLRLMLVFQLALPIDEEGKTLLIPTLLPVELPPGCDEPDDQDRKRLRYEFAVVPGPLLPRLLVRTFSLIERERRWRRGAILRYSDARARVWATQDERWVHVTAVGPKLDRDDLLTMIRGTLRELFTEYRDLRVVEQWEYNGSWVPRKTLEDIGELPREDVREDVKR